MSGNTILLKIALGALVLGSLLLVGAYIVDNGAFGSGYGQPEGSGGQPLPVEATSAETESALPTRWAGAATATATDAPTETSTPTPHPSPTRLPTSTPTEAPTTAPAATHTPEPTATSTPRPTATEVTEPTATPAGTVADAPEPTEAVAPPSTESAGLVPATPVGAFGSQFQDRLWVGLYGTPAGRGLGILGTATATATVAMAEKQALAYQVLLPNTQVVPFFHMVTTIADPFPGPDGDYVHRVKASTIGLWIDVAARYGLFSVLDIQPGYSPIAAEIGYVGEFLQRPGVHLAIDPEFLMLDGVSVPGQRIGTMTGDLVNQAQAMLSEHAAVAGERKVLVIHQFDNRMFVGKESIVDYPNVDLVWDADGFGGPGAKIGDYQQYAAEPGFEFGGFKMFYDYDVPLMQPQAVLELEPFPAFLVYQ